MKQQSEIRYLPIDNHTFTDRAAGDIMTILAKACLSMTVFAPTPV
jgi:hypothetical protein